MARCLQKVKCNGCGHNSLQPFLNDDGTVSGFCFGSCQRYFKDPFNGNPPDTSKMKIKSPEEIQAEMNEIRSCPYVPFYRGIQPEYWKRFGVRQTVNEYTGEPFHAIWHPHTRDGKLVAYMAKGTKKNERGKTPCWCLGEINQADLYGWEIAKRIGGKTLYITEGQEDTLALSQILENGSPDPKFRGVKQAVVSLPNGVKSVDVIGRMAADITRMFQEVVLVFDDDEPGQDAVSKALIYLPKARVVILPAKDANDCIKDGLVVEAYRALVFKKASKKPEALVTFRDIRKDINKVAEMGITTPWDELTQWIRGWHTGCYAIAGGEGLGKTTFLHQIIAKNCQMGIGNLAFMLEEDKEKTFANSGSKIIGRDLTDPNREITDEECDILDPIFHEEGTGKPRLYVFNVEKDRSSSAEEFADFILECAYPILDNFGFMLIDNLTKVTETIPTAAERNDFISSFVAKMDTFARRTGKIVFVLSHFNKQQKGETPYNEGGRGNMNQIAGGSGLQRYCEGIFFAERNSQGKDASCIKLRVAKNRQGKVTGVIKMYYEKETTRIIEADWDEDLYKIQK